MNRVKAIDAQLCECPYVEGRDKIMESYAGYLADESRLGCDPIDILFFPVNTEQVAGAVKEARRRNLTIIVSGSRTGITGGAVSIEGSAVISLEKMNSSIGAWCYQAGVRLDEIERKNGEYYPVDPTEMTASVGGTVATDASGARSYRYGSTRNFIEALKVVLSDGSVLQIKRGSVFAEDGEFVIEADSGEIVVPVADIGMPPVKNTAGFYMASDMDLIDLFIGCEGALGIITEVEVRHIPVPEDRLFLVVYAESEQQALRLSEQIKADEGIEAVAIEYFGPNAINLIRDNEGVAQIPDDAVCAVYLEILIESDDIEERLSEALEACGLTMDATWAGFEEKDLEEMKHFRHAIPEKVNSIIGQRRKDIPELHKIGTDTAVPNGMLSEFLSDARASIEARNIDYVVFGHLGDNHLHINMLPASIDDLEAARELYVQLARKSVDMGGTVSAEHGIGRLKKHFMEIQYGEAELLAMNRVKRALDPDAVLNPGVML